MMAPGDVVLLELPARLGYASLLGDMVMALLPAPRGDPDGGHVAYHVQLAVHETFTNIVSHAYADEGEGEGRIQMTFRRETDCLVIDVRDWGRAFDPGAVPAPDLHAGPESGLGLFVIRELMDEVVYEAATGGNHWRLLKKL